VLVVPVEGAVARGRALLSGLSPAWVSSYNLSPGAGGGLCAVGSRRGLQRGLLDCPSCAESRAGGSSRSGDEDLVRVARGIAAKRCETTPCHLCRKGRNSPPTTPLLLARGWKGSVSAP
jgi:DNA-binding helix-hairpin-helix protein with protein kinase domain